MSAPASSPLFRLLAAAALAAPLAGLAQSAPATAPSAGEVILAAGPVYLVQGEARTPLPRGSQILAGQTIVTGEGGFAHLRMADGGLVAVRPFSTFQVEVFDYHRSRDDDRVRYRLDEGVARAITGGVGEANKEAFRLNTPVAAVGVRGTDFVVATSPAASRVAINSGAVIVAALGEHCTASGFGACTDGGMLLGKGDSLPGQYVEVVRGEQAPRMVQDPSQTPDRVAPPHPDESALTVGDRLPDTRLTDGAMTVERNDETAFQPQPVSPPPASEVTPPEGVYWGRWSSTVAVDDGSAMRVAELLAAGKSMQVVNSYYGAGLEDRATQLPRQGRADFVAAGGSGVLHGAAPQALTVADGRLGVDFDRRSFTTEARFQGAERDFNTQAAGHITSAGYLQSDAAISNSQVSGALGANLDSAVTTVERQFDEGLLSGVVTWGRQ
ncbi:MAG: FecR family protein [Pigmentiphaga sp.]|nr:FecR family protein [Pigmentiphaga sp.]